MFEVVVGGGGCLALMSSHEMWSSKFEVVMGECLTPDPPTTTPKLQLDFLDLENFLVNIWGGGGGVSGTRPPHHHHPP